MATQPHTDTDTDSGTAGASGAADAGAVAADPLAWLAEGLAERRAADRLRTLQQARPLPGGYLEADGQRLLNLSGNDYLGLALDLDPPAALADLAALGGDPAASYAAAAPPAAGATASRLVVGNHPAYAALEADVAALKGTTAALVFGCGYSANVGAIQALVGRGDTVYSDRLNHASIVDGIVLSRATLQRYRHGDLAHLAELLQRAPARGRRLIVTDTVFSMDGDLAPLAALVELKDRYGAMLMVDEAHAGGVYGPGGSGLVGALGLSDRVEVQLGTFSKAYGGYGAYIAGRQTLVDHLTNHARSFIYSTGLPPLVVALARQALARSRHDEWRRQRLWDNIATFRVALAAHGLPVPPVASPILPLHIGPDAETLAIARSLRQAGYAAIAIRPPTVPEHTARLRLSLSAAHEPADLQQAAGAIARSLHASRSQPG